MTLYDLGIEYLNQADILYNKALILRDEARFARGSIAEDINSRSLKFFTMAIECRRTGKYLVSYYEYETNAKCKTQSAK